jgi:hypothetical protein
MTGIEQIDAYKLIQDETQTSYQDVDGLTRVIKTIASNSPTPAMGPAWTPSPTAVKEVLESGVSAMQIEKAISTFINYVTEKYNLKDQAAHAGKWDMRFLTHIKVMQSQERLF